MKVIKRDGRECEFDISKIVNAITSAMVETEAGVSFGVAIDIANDIADNLENLSDDDEVISVEEIQDAIEQLLAEYGRFDVSKTYILYRAKKNELREKGWDMTELQQDIYDKKYRYDNETFPEFLDRVSGGNDYIRKAIRDKRFLPAGRILAGRGLKYHGKNVTLSNCYVMPKIEDNIESIFDTAKYLAKTYSYGGGCGINISNLRPMGSKVQNSASTTTGATSFMDLYSMVTGLIGQKGRRGALMINIDVNHPDIEHFIDIKNSDSEKVRFANISINITDDFMRQVVTDGDYELNFKVEATGEVISKVVKARELFRKIAENNWNSAEPGMLFKDKIDNWHLMSHDPTFEYAGVNP
jgi:ribonucleoside-diphosphate reductase alpha chain